ncbi:glycosyltransferase [Epilithonimonas ginsengisoli]|uniref:Glycosyltransferase n=1 Tax=Epilithonimonas ginsengisoli TaxID=1245592 RepID=A0ABU4JJF8_9FLAO|nr:MULTISPECIES: glycosyltransferase [Chryseobacterium group]MBV6880935.1 glycosyltransferase [Epilithonimonas sp. FP105]MDW8549825.1 glycosyltransferase [Epilithonimonas ginsengisoli]OAH66589.1 glycosyltransferase [Chryseobacterium sp. FP211-J200]
MNRKIKILFRHRSMEMGGVEKVILGLLDNLDKSKLDITILVSLYQGELREKIPSHIRYIKMNKGKEDFSKNPLLNKIQLVLRGLKIKFLEIFPAIADKIYLKEKFDVEIASSYTDFSSVLASSNKDSKKIGWFHSDITFPKLQPAVPLILSQIPKFDYFIFGSQQTKDILEKTYPELRFPENSVILNAIPIEEIKEKAQEFVPNFETSNPVFVSVGRLHSRKGYKNLIEVHSKLIKDGFLHKVIIIGDGEEMDNLRNLIEELKVENSFILMGSLLNPYPYVKNADFFIMPSESEGWPLIIADTLTLQKPIISTAVGGIPEMITHQDNGYLINYDSEEIYSAMKEFMINKNLIEAIQEKLKTAEEQFDNQKIFDAVENIIINLAKK